MANSFTEHKLNFLIPDCFLFGIVVSFGEWIVSICGLVWVKSKYYPIELFNIQEI